MAYWIDVIIHDVLGMTFERRLELGFFLVNWQYLLLFLLLLLPWSGRARTQWIRWLVLSVCVGVAMLFADFCWVYIRWPVETFGVHPPSSVSIEIQRHMDASMAVLGGAISLIFGFQIEPKKCWKKVLGILLSLQSFLCSPLLRSP